MATIGHIITVDLGEWTPSEPFDWSDFFIEASAVIETAAPPEESTGDSIIDDPNPVLPDDPYWLTGTDGADRFEFKAGYDNGYIIVDFEPGKDVIVIDGESAGITAEDLADPTALTEDALDKFYYREGGSLAISAVLDVSFASTYTDNGMDSPALTAADFVIV